MPMEAENVSVLGGSGHSRNTFGEEKESFQAVSLNKGTAFFILYTCKPKFTKKILLSIQNASANPPMYCSRL